MTVDEINEFQALIMEIHGKLIKVEPCPYVDHTLQNLEEAVNTLQEKKGMLDIDDLLGRLN